jgi:hypothetical protein
MWHMSRLGARNNQGMVVFNSPKCSRSWQVSVFGKGQVTTRY